MGIEFLDEMIISGFFPNNATYMALFHGLSQQGNFIEVVVLVNEMVLDCL